MRRDVAAPNIEKMGHKWEDVITTSSPQTFYMLAKPAPIHKVPGWVDEDAYGEPSYAYVSPRVSAARKPPLVGNIQIK